VTDGPLPLHRSIDPMTLGNMREHGVRSLSVTCWQCHHETIINVDHWPGETKVPSFGPKMVCTKWGPSAPMRGRIGGKRRMMSSVEWKAR
jgi:hypothetical protein